jgi:DNA-binding NarL/FixJ family response regulator
MNALRVVCVEDQQTLADALRLAVTSEPDLECAGTARTVDEALVLVRQSLPDVVLMDVVLPGALDGIEGTRRVKATSPATRVVILTAVPTLDLVARAAAAGANGFLAKDAPLDAVLEQVRSTGGGQMRIDATAVLAMTVRDAGISQPPVHLTPRETEVLGHLVDGVTVGAMAPMLGISVHTCREYVRSLLSKLGVHSQLEAVAQARRLGVVPDQGAPEGRTPQG